MKPRNFSIVVTTYCRLDMLRQVLKSISRLKYDFGSVEVLIVDNDSLESAKNVYKKWKKSYPNQSQYICEPNPGPSYARNTGIRLAKYKTIILVDDDVLLESDYLERCRMAVESHSQAAIIGGQNQAVSIDGYDLSNWLRILKGYWWLLAQSDFHFTKPHLIDFPYSLYSACMCIQLHQMGTQLFDENRLGRRYGETLVFAEDHELCLRMQLERRLVLYDPRLRSKHMITCDRLSFSSIFNRLIMSGVEQRIIDNKLRVYPAYISHKFSFMKYFQMLYGFITSNDIKHQLFSIGAESARDLGYYLLSYKFKIKNIL